MWHRLDDSKAIMRGDGKWNCLTSVPCGRSSALCSNHAKHDMDAGGNPTKCHRHKNKTVAQKGATDE
jgi:hypothetical protein